MKLAETKKEMDFLCQDLMQDIKAVRKGNLTIVKASTISKLASNAIKTVTGVIVTLQHQEIQFKKLIQRKEELEYKKSLLVK